MASPATALANLQHPAARIGNLPAESCPPVKDAAAMTRQKCLPCPESRRLPAALRPAGCPERTVAPPRRPPHSDGREPPRDGRLPAARSPCSPRYRSLGVQSLRPRRSSRAGRPSRAGRLSRPGRLSCAGRPSQARRSSPRRSSWRLSPARRSRRFPHVRSLPGRSPPGRSPQDRSPRLRSSRTGRSSPSG